MGAAPDFPVAVIDSGLGGLSVLSRLRELAPAEDLAYLADCEHAPWGDRPAAWVRDRSLTLARWARDELGAKALVLACNTATAVAVEELRARLDLPIIGIEPAVKPAAARTRSGRVGVLATSGTLASPRYRRLLERFAHGVTVRGQAGPGLVELVERGQLDGPATVSRLRRCLDPLLAEGIDTLVLGCTHYPFLLPVIRRLVGPGVTVIEPGRAVAAVCCQRLAEAGLARGGTAPGREIFYLKGMTAARPVLTRLWPTASSALILELPV